VAKKVTAEVITSALLNLTGVANQRPLLLQLTAQHVNVNWNQWLLELLHCTAKCDGLRAEELPLLPPLLQ